MNQAIEIKGLCKSYPGFALQNVSFSLPEGSIMGFIGENGAGKTTTIKSILGLVRPDAGEISVLGLSPAADRRRIGEQIGTVLDGSFFSETLRTGEISAVMSRLHPGWDRELFSGYCRRFSLPDSKPAKDFSKGMKAKLALATALAHRPRLLILDEATSGLDPVVRSEMLDLFLEFIEDETHSILLSSHLTRGRSSSPSKRTRWPPATACSNAEKPTPQSSTRATSPESGKAASTASSSSTTGRTRPTAGCSWSRRPSTTS